eukprot:1406970-Rhodomonas_salina.1
MGTLNSKSTPSLRSRRRGRASGYDNSAGTREPSLQNFDCKQYLIQLSRVINIHVVAVLVLVGDSIHQFKTPRTRVGDKRSSVHFTGRRLEVRMRSVSWELGARIFNAVDPRVEEQRLRSD